MSYDGVFIDGRTVRFERLLPGPIARVWDHLTKPELLATWLASAGGDMRKGGEITLSFTFSAHDGCSDSICKGTVLDHDPPHLLSYTWREFDAAGNEKPASVVRFDLAEEGDDVRLVLTHRKLATNEMAGFGAGWDSHLTYLAARIGGQKVKPFVLIFDAAMKHYRPLARSVAGAAQDA